MALTKREKIILEKAYNFGDSWRREFDKRMTDPDNALSLEEIEMEYGLRACEEEIEKQLKNK